MYNPSTMREERPELLLRVMREYPFATLLTPAHGELCISHVPLLAERDASTGAFTVLGHLARANRHWQALAAGHTTLAVFQGPHGYISPAWYAEHPSVPTWNYAVVHLHGRPRLLDAPDTHGILRSLVERFESERSGRWSGDLPADFVTNELEAIVGFALDVERVEGKFKLSQSKSEADRSGAIAGLEAEGDFRSRELASFMRQHAR